MTKIKVCGITTIEDALVAVEIGASYLGFNFYRPSPRYIPFERAREIIDQLPKSVVPVGVFVNEPEPQMVLDGMALSGVEIAQLHGDEDDEYCQRVGASRVIKALRIGPVCDASSFGEFSASAFLVDAYDEAKFGGTGKTANWTAARLLGQRRPVFLAGGLSPANICEAITAVQPYAVDVNSGVEASPGKKDPSKLRALRTAMDAGQTQRQ